jgi:hypothetical protein
MRQLVYDPANCGPRINIVRFVSGSGTHYREVAARDVNNALGSILAAWHPSSGIKTIDDGGQSCLSRQR